MPGVKKNDPSYDDKRAKNNSSVQACRERQRRKKQETEQEVNQLRTENGELEGKLKELNMELKFLKEMYGAHNNTEASQVNTASLSGGTPKIENIGNSSGTNGIGGTHGIGGNSSRTQGIGGTHGTGGNNPNVIVEQLYTLEKQDWNKSGWNS